MKHSTRQPSSARTINRVQFLGLPTNQVTRTHIPLRGKSIVVGRQYKICETKEYHKHTENDGIDERQLETKEEYMSPILNVENEYGYL